MRASSASSESSLKVAANGLGSRVLIGVLLAVVVVSGLTLFGDASQMATALGDFGWSLLVPILALTLFNYALRFVKWELYLRRLAIPPIPLGTSVLVFLSGFSMSITPGTIGELIKCLYLRRLTGVPIARTSAVVAAERITDGLAMLALAGIGLTQFTYGRPFLAVAFAGAIGIILLLRPPGLLESLLGRVSHWPLVGRVTASAVAFAEASELLLRPRLLVAAIGLGVVSWAGECLAFFLILVGLRLDPSWHLLLVATFVLAVSTLVGAVSMLPGGLGVADASVAGMLLLLVPDDAMMRGTAVVATLLIRFATLWFAVILGAVAVAILQRGTALLGGRTETILSEAP